MSQVEHIDLRVKHVTELLRERGFAIRWVSGVWNLADLFTKPLGKTDYIRMRNAFLVDSCI